MEIFSNFKALTLVFFFFGASIFVHELGHFLAARWRGLKVTRFSIGFGPKLFGWTRDGVEYIVAAFPIGGYVALPQLGHMEIIEGEAQPSEEAEVSWTSKVIVLVAGALFNVIFALFLGSILYFLGGRPVPIYNDITQLGTVSETLRISEDELVPNPAFIAGLQRGDTVKAIDGKSVDKWEKIEKRVLFGTRRTEDDRPLSLFTIERDGKTLEIEVFPIIATMERIRTIGIIPELPRDLPALVGSVYKGFPADVANIEPGDELIKIDGQLVESTDQVSQYIQQNLDKEITVELLRNGEIVTTVVTPKLAVLGESGQKMPMIGVAWSFPKKLLLETPLVQVRSVISETLETLQKLVNPKSDIKLSNMSGPVGMGRIIYKSAKWDIRMVFWVVIIININLAIINLLPIPVLDGGHIVFSTIEKIRGRALPQNLMMSLQGAFVIALLSLMLYVTVFDGKRYVAEKKQEKSNTSSVITPKLVPSENSDSESQ